jgi:DNA-binding SARP family transcriptional activator/Tfp pilus assembly protein PilF/TolB-like protein
MGEAWELRVVGESNLVAADGTRTNLSAKPKRFAVLVFLAVPTPGARVRRDVLLATFWPELDAVRARNALRATLHQLRQALGPDAIRGSGEDELWLDPAVVRVDLTDLSRALDVGDLLPWLTRASLELVPGLHVHDAGPFEEWLDGQRRALAARLVRSAWALADAAEGAADLPRAVLAARSATRLARADETGLRRLVSLLDRCGDRGGALTEFELFEAWLREEFEAAPAPETLALVQCVRGRTLAAPPSSPPSRSTGAAAPALATQDAVVPGPIAATRATLGWHVPPSRRVAGWLGALAAVIVAATGWSLSRTGASPPAAGALVPLAILPFENEVGDTAARYLAPALAESVADGLPSAAALPYAATRALDPRDHAAARRRLRAIGAETVVSAVLGGTRDSLELLVRIERLDGHPLAPPVRLHGSERGLVFLHDSLIALVSRAVAVPPDVRVRHTPAPAAYQLSLNAAWLLSRRSRPELLAARDLYTRALEIDPAWADLWLGLARATGSLGYRHYVEYRPALLASEHAANEALKRAPSDGRALIERALARFQLGNHAGAEADARRAAALDSTDWHMQSLIGTWWQWSGSHLDSALAYTRRAQRLAPWDRQTSINVMQIVGCMRDSAAIVTAARHVLDMDPNNPEALETLAWTLTRFGRWDDATRAYEQRYASLVAEGVSAQAAHLRREARFRATVRAIRRAVYQAQRIHPPATPPLLESRIALFEDLGMRDSSIAALAAVVDSLDAHHANMLCAANLRDFRRDPRALAIVRQRGWPLAEFAPTP